MRNTARDYSSLDLFKSLKAINTTVPSLHGWLGQLPDHLFDQQCAFAEALVIATFDSMKAAAEHQRVWPGAIYGKIQRINADDIRILARTFLTCHSAYISILLKDRQLHGWMHLDDIVRDVLHRRVHITCGEREEMVRSLFSDDPRMGDLMVEVLQSRKFGYSASFCSKQMDSIYADREENPDD